MCYFQIQKLISTYYSCVEMCKITNSFLLQVFLFSVGYNMTKSTLNTREARLTAYHRVIEAFKFAYAQRSELGAPAFNSSVTEVLWD